MSRVFCKSNLKDVFLSVLFGVLISIGLVLIFALFVKWFMIGENGISIGNTVIKLLSVFIGIILGFKTSENGAIKGAISGLFYTLLSYLTFSLYSGESILYGLNLLSILFGIISGVISGIIAVNIRK